MWFGYFGWLPALVPADARTFRVSDPMLAELLRDAGGEIVEETPDAEIADLEHIAGDAELAIVTIEPGYVEESTLLASVARRARRTISARVSARRASRRLNELGYGETDVVLWDIDQFVHLPGGRPTGRRRPAELMPQRALVVGRRGDPTTTLLEAVAQEFGGQVGSTVEYSQPLARQGLSLALAGEYVLRVAIGHGRRKIELQEAALERLAAADPPPVLEQRVPKLLAKGRLGLGDWCVEERLPGRIAPHELDDELMEDCIDFLVALHGIGRGEPGPPLAESAKTLAAACTREDHRERALDLGHRLDAELGHVPRGFSHGDFWTNNLLVVENRLRGVIDWDASRPGRLPLLDLLHLQLSARREKTREFLGVALVGRQLPWAEAGGDDIVDVYCRRIGIDVDGPLLTWFVLAYWIERIAFELYLFPDRAQRPVWMRNNVEVVLDALGAQESSRPGTRLVS